MEILVIIIMFMIVSFGGVIGATFFGKKYEVMLPITHFALIIVLFGLGLANRLKLGVWLICIIVLIGYLVCILYILKNRIFNKVKKNIFTECFWVFLIAYLVIYACNIGKEVHYIDEFVCWATRVKDMCRLDTLYTSDLAHVDAKAYPPSTALIQYLYQKIQYVIVGEKRFVPWYLFVSYQVYMVSFLIPLLSKVELKKKNIQFYLVSLFVLILPMVFYNNAYDTIMVDQLMGVMIGYCFVVLKDRKGSVFELIVFIMCQICLVLTKDIAVFFCIMMWGYWILDILIENRFKKGRWVSQEFCWSLLGMLIVYLTQFCWNKSLTNGNLLVSGSNSLISQHSSQMSIKVFLKAALGIARDYRMTSFLNFCRAFFSCDREKIYIDTGCYFLGNFRIGSLGLGVSYFALSILFLILLLILYKEHKGDYERRRQRFLIFGIYLLMIGYFGIVLLTNMFLFDENEAVALVAYDRYLEMVFLMVAYIIISEWIEYKWNQNGNPSFYWLLIICLMIPGEPLVQFLDRQNVYDSQAVSASYVKDANKIEKVVGNNEAKICYMNFDKNETTSIYYKLKFGFDANKIEFMKGQENKLLIKKERDKILKRYDYILIYNNNNRFRHLINAEIQNEGYENFDIYKVKDMQLIRIL